jgi:2'-5' RNA ligase
VDHAVIPLDGSHRDALRRLGTAVSTHIGIDEPDRCLRPHITVAAYDAFPARRVACAFTRFGRGIQPFVAHAHGYGFFSGDSNRDLSLHLDVVRAPELDVLHGCVLAALHDLGADVAPWSEPDAWSPHITLIDRALTPEALGRATAWLARRHHPSWHIPVERIAFTGGWDARDLPATEVVFTAMP